MLLLKVRFWKDRMHKACMKRYELIRKMSD